MAFFGTKVEKQGDRERDRRPATLQVVRRRRKWVHTQSRIGLWEMLERNDACVGAWIIF